MKNDLRSAGLTAGEICLLDCVNDSRHQLCQLMQRWDDRVTVENLNLVKAYVEGRCSITLKFEIFPVTCLGNFGPLAT